MQGDDKTQDVPGPVLTVPLYQSFADGISMLTADGGRLVCRTTGTHERSDGPPQISASCLGAVSPLPTPVENEPFALTTAIVDADGRVWQRTRAISIYEIWGAVMESPILYQMFEQPSEDPIYRNAESVSRRVLIEPVNTLADHRARNLVEIIRERENMTANQPSPYENGERLVFRFRFKYFGAIIGLVEDRPAFRVHSTGQLACNSCLVVTIHPTTDADHIVALDNHDVVLQTQRVSLNELGTLCSREAKLRPGWEQPSWELPHPGDIAEWQRKLREAGVEPSTITAFRPNPSIRYEPAASAP